MSLKENLGKIAGKAKVVAEKSGDKIASGVDKATDKLDKKTGGKYHDKLEKVDKLASKLDKDRETEATDATDATPPAEGTDNGETPPTGTMPS
jgi:hypothetical protein